MMTQFGVFFASVTKRIRRKIPEFLLASVCFFHILIAQAAVINAVDVHGNTRISSRTILEKSGLKPGEDISSEDIDIALKNLFASGYFSDVHIKPVGNRLRIEVHEASTINAVLFRGNKKIKSEQLQHVVSSRAHSSFDDLRLKSDVQAIKTAYQYMGCNAVAVSAQAIPVGHGVVNLVFTISEGQRTKIAHINFYGNHAFSAMRLRDVISIKQTNFLSWLTQHDIYNEQRLQVDKEALRHFYFSHGYADFRILSAQANFSPETNSYTINFTIEEGLPYKFGPMRIETAIKEVAVRPLYAALTTKYGRLYNVDEIQKSILALNNKVTSSGYAFGRVTVHTSRDFARHLISLIYDVEEGPHFYIERIEIVGNTKTKDYVIRREFDVSEGDAFNQTLIAAAKRRLENLGFFQSVDISTKPGSLPDQVVLVVKVAEQATGEFSLGGGYTTGGQTPGFSVDASVAEHNFLGRGQYVRLALTAGQNKARDYTLSFTQPYFLGRRVSGGFDLFETTYRPHNDYGVLQMGGVARLGFTLTDNLSATLSYNYVKEEYDLGQKGIDINTLREQYAGAIAESAQRNWLRSSLRYSFIYSTIDNMRLPRDGFFLEVAQEFAGLGGDAHYLKTSGKAVSYTTLSQQYDLVGMLSATAGTIYVPKKNGVRVFDLFQNDTDMVRGFKYNGFGPRQKSGNGTQYFIGGGKYIAATAELEYPFPLVPESVGLRGAFFADIGTLYDNPYQPNLAVEKPVTDNKIFWRSSVGASLLWASPLGPLRLDYAIPTRKAPGDLTQTFTFGISTRF